MRNAEQFSLRGMIIGVAVFAVLCAVATPLLQRVGEERTLQFLAELLVPFLGLLIGIGKTPLRRWLFGKPCQRQRTTIPRGRWWRISLVVLVVCLTGTVVYSAYLYSSPGLARSPFRNGYSDWSRYGMNLIFGYWVGELLWSLRSR